ncbi:hypothetical protein A2U01_0043966, partial [Trifolium medium]|nr:hypothetical protein [Trifolium medium]
VLLGCFSFVWIWAFVLVSIDLGALWLLACAGEAHLDGACGRFFLVMVIGYGSEMEVMRGCGGCDGSEMGWWWLRRIWVGGDGGCCGDTEVLTGRCWI